MKTTPGYLILLNYKRLLGLIFSVLKLFSPAPLLFITKNVYEMNSIQLKTWPG